MKEQDAESIPGKWVPNRRKNNYCRDLLGFEARVANRLAKTVLENEVVETLSEGLSDSGGGGGGD